MNNFRSSIAKKAVNVYYHKLLVCDIEPHNNSNVHHSSYHNDIT